MNRVFLTCVGNRDPYWLQEENKEGKRIVLFDALREKHPEELPANKQEGPILSFFAKVRPGEGDRIWLFYTAPAENVRGATKNSAEATRDALRQHFSLNDTQIRLVSLNDPAQHPDFDPSDYPKVISRMREEVQKALREIDEKADIRVIYSSGTPQMQAAWILLAKSGLLPARLFRAEGDPVEIEPLFEDQLLGQACQMMRAGAFGAAAQLLRNLEKRAQLEVSEISKDRRGLFRIFSNACQAYHHWSLFEYASAQKKLSDAARILQRFVERKQQSAEVKPTGRKASPRKSSFHSPLLDRLRGILDEQVRFLDSLRDNPRERLRDLYFNFNARRHYEQENYTEAIWRLDALCELAAVTAALKAIDERFGVQLQAADFSRQVLKRRRQLDDLIEAVYGGNPAKAPAHLTDKAAIEILKVLAPQILKQVELDDIKWLSNIRNRAIHRASAIRQNEVNRALGIAGRYGKALVGEEVTEEKTYPFNSNIIEELAGLFQTIGSGRS